MFIKLRFQVIANKQLPKEKLIYGPVQIKAMIDQNTTIAQQLTLWDKKGRESFVET